ncbi:MAG: hypothetical protein QOE35_1119 [Actinomycetota bacterium]
MRSTTRALKPPSLESLVVATLTLAGFTLGARPIGDNSMFVHLRTGIDIAAGHGIPRVDPYSFTARGSRWVVQSWLPEALYGLGRRLAGDGAVVLEQAVLMALAAWLLARLARTGSPLRTMAAGALAIGVGAAYWSPRPLLFGLVCFALVVTIVERRASPWWLVPVVWVWVNSHGSFPLGLAWLGLAGAGAWLDQRRWPAEWARYVGAFVVGLVVAAVNPLGPRLLAFAVTVGEKKEVFRLVREWRSPDFQSGSGLVTLAFLVPALVLVLRARPPWQRVIPVAVFLALGLFAVRNVSMLAVVLAPALGAALRAPEGAQEADVAPRPRLHVYVAAVLVLAFVLFGVAGAAGRTLDVSSYPVASVRWLDRQGLLGPGHRVAAQDVVGCYLILRQAGHARVFIDDRVDMYPVSVTKDYLALLHGEPRARSVLDHWNVDVVLWDRQLPLPTILRGAGGWRQVHREGDWVTFIRT